MAQRTIAVGDVHGCATAFAALVEAIQPSREDTLILLGDCVDRGPDSRRVVEQVLNLREQCMLVCLLGNHEEMMVNYLDGRAEWDDWLDVGGAATLESYNALGNREAVPKEHVEFIRDWIDYWETPSHFFVHAAYVPRRRLSQQRWELMRWQSLRDDLPGPHVSGKTAVVGHTSQKNGELLDLGYLICIDTYCWGGGWLTALDVETGRVWQVDNQGRFRR